MRVSVTFGEGTVDGETGDAEAASSLRRWLMAEPELRGRARVSPGAELPVRATWVAVSNSGATSSRGPAVRP